MLHQEASRSIETVVSLATLTRHIIQTNICVRVGIFCLDMQLHGGRCQSAQTAGEDKALGLNACSHGRSLCLLSLSFYNHIVWNMGLWCPCVSSTVAVFSNLSGPLAPLSTSLMLLCDNGTCSMWARPKQSRKATALPLFSEIGELLLYARAESSLRSLGRFESTVLEGKALRTRERESVQTGCWVSPSSLGCQQSNGLWPSCNHIPLCHILGWPYQPITTRIQGMYIEAVFHGSPQCPTSVFTKSCGNARQPWELK